MQYYQTNTRNNIEKKNKKWSSVHVKLNTIIN